MKGIGHAGERFTGFSSELVKDGLVVAEPDRVLTARMEVVLALGFLRHVTVLLLNLVAKFLHIDEIKDVCHASHLPLAPRPRTCSHHPMAIGWLASRQASKPPYRTARFSRPCASSRLAAVIARSP